MITLIAFKIRFDDLVATIEYEYDYGFEIDQYVRELELLCHNFLAIREMSTSS